MIKSTNYPECLLAAEVVLFDVDDTLLYTFDNGYDKILGAAKALGLPGISFEEYSAHYGVDSFSDCLRIWFPGGDPEKLHLAYADQADAYPYRPICDGEKLQTKLRADGKLVGILTNGVDDSKLRRKLRCCGIREDLLVGIWSAERLPSLKPSPLAFRPVQEAFPGKRILYISDATADAEMARQAGVDYLQVRTGKDVPLEGSAVDSVAVLLE